MNKAVHDSQLEIESIKKRQTVEKLENKNLGT